MSAETECSAKTEWAVLACCGRNGQERILSFSVEREWPAAGTISNYIQERMLACRLRVHLFEEPSP
jgi:hypothetical protein